MPDQSISRERRLVCRAALWLILLPGLAGAAALPDAEARELLAKRLHSLQHYQAEFEQTVVAADGELVEQSAGRFWLTRPNRFRWEYVTPWPRLILADGERIWLFDEELEQVTVRDFDGLLEQTPAALLAGRVDALDGYAISGERDSDRLQVVLVPHNTHSDFSQIELEFIAGVLAEMRLRDSFGQQTEIRFSQVETAAAEEAGIFEFSVPAGVDVIDESAG